MAYVSVEQVENLEDAITQLHSTYQALESECHVKLQQVAAKAAEAQREAEKSALLLEKASQVELQKSQSLEQAQAQMASAQGELSAAFAAFSAFESSGFNDDKGNYEPANYSFEDLNVSSAEASVTEAEEAVETATAELEQTKDYRMKMEQRSELADQCRSITTQLEETVQSECAARLSNAYSLLETGIARLEQAKSALDAYLAANLPTSTGKPNQNS
jgi:hypothetical protein